MCSGSSRSEPERVRRFYCSPRHGWQKVSPVPARPLPRSSRAFLRWCCLLRRCFPQYAQRSSALHAASRRILLCSGSRTCTTIPENLAVGFRLLYCNRALCLRTRVIPLIAQRACSIPSINMPLDYSSKTADSVSSYQPKMSNGLQPGIAGL